MKFFVFGATALAVLFLVERLRNAGNPLAPAPGKPVGQIPPPLGWSVRLAAPPPPPWVLSVI